MIVYLCASLAQRGRCSVTFNPGTLVGMGLNLTAELRLRVRLGIEGVHLAHAASQEQMDNGDIVTLLRLPPALLQRIAQRDPAKRGDRTNLDE